MGWPDWSGETAVILGTGPSAADAPIDLARGRTKVFAIKSTWKLAPWADALYGIDRGWWIANKGAAGFEGLKFSPSPTACKLFGLTQVRLKLGERVLLGETGTMACGLKTGGGHSGFQAINLAVQFGARRIVLVGFDMTLANGAHWSRDYNGVSKPDASRVNSWRVAMDGAAGHFREIGVEVVNCSPNSVLTAYPKISLSEALGVAAHAD